MKTVVMLMGHVMVFLGVLETALMLAGKTTAEFVPVYAALGVLLLDRERSS